MSIETFLSSVALGNLMPEPENAQPRKVSRVIATPALRTDSNQWSQRILSFGEKLSSISAAQVFIGRDGYTLTDQVFIQDRVWFVRYRTTRNLNTLSDRSLRRVKSRLISLWEGRP